MKHRLLEGDIRLSGLLLFVSLLNGGLLNPNSTRKSRDVPSPYILFCKIKTKI